MKKKLKNIILIVEILMLIIFFSINNGVTMVIAENLTGSEENDEEINFTVKINEVEKQIDALIIYNNIFVEMDSFFSQFLAEGSYDENKNEQTITYKNMYNGNELTTELIIDKEKNIITLPNVLRYEGDNKVNDIKDLSIEVEIEKYNEKKYIPLYLIANLDNISVKVDDSEVYNISVKVDGSELYKYDESKYKNSINALEDAKTHTIEINTVENYSRQDIISQDKDLIYIGQELGSLWREEAYKRIEKYRKSDINIVIKNQYGMKLSDANVNIKMNDNEFKFGTAIGKKKEENVNDYDGIFDTDLKLFNTIGSENGFKWIAVEKYENYANDIVAKAEENNMYLRGHCLWWDQKNFFVESLKEEIIGINDENSTENTMKSIWNKYKNNEINREEAEEYLANLKKRFEKIVIEHIERVMNKYPEIKEWDVINEIETCQYFQYYLYNNKIFDDVNAGFINDSFQRVDSEGYYRYDSNKEYYTFLAKCINTVKRKNSNTKIVINDCMLDITGNNESAIKKMQLVLAGINEAYKDKYSEENIIDAMGIQNHIYLAYYAENTAYFNGASPQYRYNAMNSVLENSGVKKIAVTEYDNKQYDTVPVNYNKTYANTDSNTIESIKAKYFKDTLISAYSNKNVYEFVSWAYSRFGDKEKDAYKEMMGVWLNDKQELSSNDGIYTTRAYKGNYTATVEIAGETYTTDFDVTDEKKEIVIEVNEVEVDSWDKLKEKINSDTCTYNANENILYRNVFNIKLKSSNNWNANEEISIKSWQKVTLIPEDNITIKRAENFKGCFITNKGILILGDPNNEKELIFDGNGEYVEAEGSIITVSNGKLTTYQNVILQNNNCGGAKPGGALTIESSDVSIIGSQIIDNKAKYGGGIYVKDNNSNVRLENAVIASNTATSASGGGMYAFGNLIIDDNTSISKNEAKTSGGGIIIKKEAIINGGQITENKAIDDGGGIRIDGKLYLNGGTIEGNEATNGYGGGIDVEHTGGNLIYEKENAKISIKNNTAGKKIANNLHPNPACDIDWTEDENLKLEKINVNMVQQYKKDENIDIQDDKKIYTYTQGMTMTDKYMVMARWNSKTQNTYLDIIDNDYKILKTISCDFGHANTLTYNPNDCRCYISYTKDGKNYIASFKINDNCELYDIKSKNVLNDYWSIAYDKDHNCFLGITNDKIYTMDTNFDVKKTNNNNEDKFFSIRTNLTKQDITYYNEHIYFACYEYGDQNNYQTYYNSKEKMSNLIYVYDLNGTLKKTLHIPYTKAKGEIESLHIKEDGTLVTNYNTADGKISIFEVKKIGLDISEIEWVNKPSKLTYIQNYEELDLSGGKIVIKYNDNTTETINLQNDKIEVTGFNNKTIGKNTVTIKYGGKEATFEVDIVKQKKVGDINGDDKINIVDVLLVKRHILAAKKENWKLTGEKFKSADLNNDNVIDIKDLLLLKRIILKKNNNK